MIPEFTYPWPCVGPGTGRSNFYFHRAAAFSEEMTISFDLKCGQEFTVGYGVGAILKAVFGGRQAACVKVS